MSTPATALVEQAVVEPVSDAPQEPVLTPEEIERLKLEQLLEEEAERQRKLEQQYTEAMERLPFPVDLLRRGLSNLGPSPKGLSYVYQKLSLPMSGISNIERLRDYPYIVYLELQGNSISDISSLGSMRYLVEIDLSNNKLTDSLKIDPPPFNLQTLELSRNQITSVDDLAIHQFLSKLCLDRNLLKSIDGLANCRNLTHLSVAKNGLTKIDALKGLPLKTLDLRWNRISSLEGIETLDKLEELLLLHNNVQTLEFCAGHPTLQVLDLEANQVNEVQEIEHLTSMKLLRSLKLRRNPVSLLPSSTWIPEQQGIGTHATAAYPPSYRLKTIFLLQQLISLDAFPVSPEEKVAATNCYDPPQNVVVSMHHVAQLKKMAKTYASIKAEDLLRAKRLRPIVLFGPNGSGKRTLTRRLLQQYPHLYGLSVSHTTRKPRPGEENGVHYHFVSKPEMQRMVEEGKFLEVVTLFGNMYGTAMESVDKVTEEGKICIMDVEIEGVVALRKSHLKPRYIYVTAPNMQVLQERLHKRNVNPGAEVIDSHVVAEGIRSTREQSVDVGLDSWLQKAQEEHHLEYDFKIVNDNLERAYRELKDYCLNVYWKDFDQEDQ
ncbi:P-loop containing nucleoside triphosphate hydrolase protein [Gorgonomyces haynaldii]|nr:P-loop containing nucleoside triphosphate hydrolase protein [Gorgonomyces haynaldii]